MSIERTNIFFISGVNCNWSSVIRKKQTEGRWLVKRNLMCLRHWWSCFPTLRIPASTRQVVAASASRRSVGGTATPAFAVLRRWQAARWLSRERSCRGGLPARERFRSPQPHNCWARACAWGHAPLHHCACVRGHATRGRYGRSRPDKANLLSNAPGPRELDFRGRIPICVRNFHYCAIGDRKNRAAVGSDLFRSERPSISLA